MSLFFRYPYLALSLLLTAQAALALLLAPRTRRRALLSGFLATPSSLLSFAFVPDYWQPARVATLVVGPEDLLFSFSTGVLVWVLAERLAGRELPCWRFSLDRAGPVILRHLVWSTLFLAVFLLSWAGGAQPMDATLLAAAVILPFVASRTRHAWRPALAAGGGFTLLYAVTFLAVLSAWPHLIHQWNHGSLWGWSLLSIPGEELAWAASFGALWPLTLAYAFDTRPPRPMLSQSQETQRL